MRSKKLALIASLAAGALILTACGETTGPTQSGGAGKSSGNLTWDDSPLAKMYGSANSWSSMTEEEEKARFEEQNRKIEEAVASCMAEQGFEYTPNLQNRGQAAFSSDPFEDPLEYAQKYGYGYTTWDEEYSQQDSETNQDPNEERLAKLSESERDAFQRALWGEGNDYNPESEEEYVYDWTTAGCRGKADHEIGETFYPETKVYEDPQWKELISKMTNLWTDQEKSPQRAELNAKWSSCMADAGFSGYSTPEEARAKIGEKASQIWDEKTGAEVPGAKDELKKLELKTAVADITCQQKIDYEQENYKIQFALEQEFIDANRTEIEAFIAALQSANSSTK